MLLIWIFCSLFLYISYFSREPNFKFIPKLCHANITFSFVIIEWQEIFLDFGLLRSQKDLNSLIQKYVNFIVWSSSRDRSYGIDYMGLITRLFVIPVLTAIISKPIFPSFLSRAQFFSFPNPLIASLGQFLSILYIRSLGSSCYTFLPSVIVCFRMDAKDLSIVAFGSNDRGHFPVIHRISSPL